MSTHYCLKCGNPTAAKIPAGDDRVRSICPACDYIHYENPKVIVGTLPVWEDQILLCKRAIAPQHGRWTLPAGFMENHETLEEGALRETHEEANAQPTLQAIQWNVSIPHISQIYILFLATLDNRDFSPGIETLATQLFTENTTPWNQIAFPVITYILKTYFAERSAGTLQSHTHTLDYREKYGLVG